MKKSILIVLTGSLGDIARALCLPARIKGHLPQSRITWLVENRWKDLVADHPYIDTVLVFERTWRIQPAAKILGRLRSGRYDITLDLQRILKSGLLSLASGADRRIGFHPRNAKEMNWLFNNEHIGFFDDRLPKLQHYLKFAEHLGATGATQLDFGLEPGCLSDAAAEHLAEKRPYIAVVTGSSWPSKDWHPQGYIELIGRILSRGTHRVVLLGDRTQAHTARELCDRLPTTGVVNMVDRTSIRALTAILAAADAAVGPDTGTGHLAAATRTPYVTLMGPTEPGRVAPSGSEDYVVRGKAPCMPCRKATCAHPEHDCMKTIGAAAVMDMLEVALAQRRRSPR